MAAWLRPCYLFISILTFASPAFSAISFTTLNIKYYGLYSGSSYHQEESRDATLRDYLETNSLRTDVMVFQEIVDVDRLRNNVVGFGYDCVSYTSRAAKHQHVVVCHKPTLTFDIAEDDDNYILEDVALGNDMYRPAVHGILRYANSGVEVAHLVAVHLKAMPEDADMRLEQIQMIHDYLAFERADSLPVVLLGDTNLFAEDVDGAAEILSSASLRLGEITVPGEFTYRTTEVGQKFDRFWVSRGLSVRGSPRIVGPCNATGPQAYAQIRAHTRDVSDHCAVSLNLRVLGR